MIPPFKGGAGGFRPPPSGVRTRPLHELRRIMGDIDEWIVRRAVMGEVVTPDRTWRRIRRLWPGMSEAEAEWVYQGTRKSSHTFGVGDHRAPVQRMN